MLSPQEKTLLEREFIARQNVDFRRRTLYRRVFVVGVFAAICGAALREFRIPTFATPVLWLVWLACVVSYLGVAAFPSSFMRDMDARWHLNPWQEALSSLSEGKTQIEAIGLLITPFLARGLFSLVNLGFTS
jgi:hypothetical protein